MENLRHGSGPYSKTRSAVSANPNTGTFVFLHASCEVFTWKCIKDKWWEIDPLRSILVWRRRGKIKIQNIIKLWRSYFSMNASHFMSHVNHKIHFARFFILANIIKYYINRTLRRRRNCKPVMHQRKASNSTFVVSFFFKVNLILYTTFVLFSYFVSCFDTHISLIM